MSTDRSKQARFDQMVEEHGAGIYGAALRLSRNPDDAQDLLQDTLLRAFRAFDTFAEGTNEKAWLIRILTNRYISLIRKTRKVNITGLDDEMPAPEGDGTIEIAGALDEEIDCALKSLSEGVRLAVVLVDLEGMTYEEAADTIGIPIGTVRSRLNRGREILKRLLADYASNRRIGKTESTK
jgi:RNA polymerase sigma-70 factor (ECF subfamily)